MVSDNCRYDKMNLKQLSELEFLLLGDLRDVLEEKASEQNRKWICAIVETLLKTVPREFALREQDGYLQEVVETCPEVSNEVNRLLQEHKTLRMRLQELLEELYMLRPFYLHASVLKCELSQWMDNLKQHNRREETLVQNTYTRDLGVGD